MNRQLGGKQGGEASDPLSLLVHAADSQRSSAKGGSQGKQGEHGGGGRDEHMTRGPPPASLEEQMAQRQAAFRAEALHHQGLLSQLRGGSLGGESDFFQQHNNNHGLVAAQQQQQAAALALASDIRTAVAAAQQLRQAAQFQNHDFLLARTAALQQLGTLGGGGGGGGGGGFEQLQQELELHKLEEMERRQLMAAAVGGNPMGALAARQQELQEAHMRQEQLDRQLSGGGDRDRERESMLERAGLRAPTDGGGRTSTGNGGSKDSFQKTPGSVVVPCRARGMPMDHNFKTAYFVIPENVEHGEELICSYFACRNAGIKFRYCTHCKVSNIKSVVIVIMIVVVIVVYLIIQFQLMRTNNPLSLSSQQVPVAKRNFRKRHKHGKSSSGNDGEEDEDVEDEEEVPKPKPPMAMVMAMDETPKKDVSAFCQEIPKKMDIPVPVVVPKKMKAPKEPRPVSNENDVSVLPPIAHQARPKISAERECLWGQLLAKRPPTKDGEAVSAWLMEVLSVSDLDTPLKENGQVAPNAAISLPFKTTGVPGAAAQLAAASKNWGKSNGSSKEADSPVSGVVIKKKRPLSVILQKNDDDEEAADDSPKEDGTPSKKDVGSFAEWKDRKKHKSLPKKGFSMQTE